LSALERRRLIVAGALRQSPTPRRRRFGLGKPVVEIPVASCIATLHRAATLARPDGTGEVIVMTELMLRVFVGSSSVKPRVPRICHHPRMARIKRSADGGGDLQPQALVRLLERWQDEGAQRPILITPEAELGVVLRATLCQLRLLVDESLPAVLEGIENRLDVDLTWFEQPACTAAIVAELLRLAFARPCVRPLTVSAGALKRKCLQNDSFTEIGDPTLA